MVGGWVIESLMLPTNKWRVWVVDRHGDERGIYMPPEDGRLIVPGDAVWWQGATVFWTSHKPGAVQDIPLSRIGYAFDPSKRHMTGS